MKKFVFTLQKVYEMKIREQDEHKLFIQNVDKRMEYIDSLMRSLEEEASDYRKRHDDECKRGTTAFALRNYNEYYQQTSYQRKSYVEQIDILTRQRLQRQQILIQNINEIKILDERKQMQYQQYCMAIRQEESKQIDELISFNVCKA